MIRISILAGKRDRMNALGHLWRRRGLLAVGLLLALATVFGVGTASADPAGPPVNTSPPVISGTAQSGQTLTADPGSWSGDTSGGFSYQWQRCDTQGANCTPIAGATNATYTAGEFGITHVVEVSVNSTVAASSATAVVRAPSPAGGTCTLVPRVGDADLTVFTVTCENWSDYFQWDPLTYSVQVWSCGSAEFEDVNCSLEYTTIPSFVPRVEFVVSGFNHDPGGGADRVTMIICQHDGSCTTWTGTAYVADDGRPHSNPASPPTISGDAWLGETLSAEPGEWSGDPDPASFTYQWQQCWSAAEAWSCGPIDGATDSTYTVQASDLGVFLSVVVTATNEVGQSQGRPEMGGGMSARTSRVVHAPPANTAAPLLNDTGGQLVSGDVLSTDGGSWTGDIAGFSYQWQRCDTHGANCNPISGATTATYTVQPSDLGATIVLGMTATNSDGLSTNASSLPTSSVDPTAPSNTVQPQIDTSSPLVGTQVSATTGTWTGPPVPAAGDFSYKWYRCGDGCTLIGGATGSTYTPVEADFGYQLAVVVTATTVGGSISSNLNDAVLTDPVAHTDVFLSIGSGPNDLADSDSATLSFSSPQEPNVDFECFLDEVAMGPCSSPVSYTDLAEGEHSFSVHATDFLGLESGVNTTDPVWEWTVDTTAPIATVDSAPSGSTTATVASFSFHADDPAATFECKLDAGSWTDCVSPKSYSSLALGGHSFQVRATDAAELVSAPVSVAWTVIAAPSNDPTPEPPSSDPTPEPTPTLTVIPTRPGETATPRSIRPGALPPVSAPEFSTSATVQLVIGAPAGATQIVISNQPDFADARSFPVNADGVYTWTLLSGGAANGDRCVYVRFTTPAGESAALTSTVKLDDKAPVVSKLRYVGEAKSGKAGQSRVFLNVPATDPASGMRYIQFAQNKKNPWGWAAYTSKTSVRTNQHFIWVRTADNAGNVSGWQKIVFPKTLVVHKRRY